MNETLFAMIHYQLQRPEEAQKALQDADKRIKRLRSKPESQGRHDVLVAKILHNEAAAKINAKDEPMSE